VLNRILPRLTFANVVDEKQKRVARQRWLLLSVQSDHAAAEAAGDCFGRVSIV
jgi:hypothetical protein